MKVLVADDERIIRKAIIHVINWAALGITHVLEARNGREALAEYDRHHPEIIITDIRMPLLDGLALVRAIRERDEGVQIIYITGFSDVSYLRSAVKNAAVDYVLKPVDPEELLAALEKCVSRVREQVRSRSYLSELERYARLSTPLLRQQLLSRVLYGAYPSREIILESAATAGLPLDTEASYQAAVFSFRKTGQDALPDMSGDILSAGIVNIAEEVLREGTGEGRAFPGYVCHLGDLDFACLLPGEEPEVNLRLLGRVQYQVGQALRLCIRGRPPGSRCRLAGDLGGRGSVPFQCAGDTQLQRAGVQPCIPGRRAADRGPGGECPVSQLSLPAGERPLPPGYLRPGVPGPHISVHPVQGGDREHHQRLSHPPADAVRSPAALHRPVPGV